MFNPALHFSGIEVKDAKYLPYGAKPAANISVVLTDGDVGLKPNPKSSDYFMLVRRSDDNRYHVNNKGFGGTGDDPKYVDASDVDPLLRALRSRTDIEFDPEVSRDAFHKALARMEE